MKESLVLNILSDFKEVAVTMGVRFRTINMPFLMALSCVSRAASSQGVQATVTSAADFSEGRKLLYHEQGYAWDFRSRDWPNPLTGFADIQNALALVDRKYRVLYHDSGFGLHYHVEYRYDMP